MTPFKSMPPAAVRREAALGPLKVLAEWAALLGVGLVALIRVFADRDQTPEIISAPLEADDLDDGAPLEGDDHVR